MRITSSDLSLGYDERGDRLCAEPPHRLQSVAAIRRPEAFLRRGHGDDRIEEHAGAIEHIGKAAVMRLRKVALEGCRLDCLDRQHRGDHRLFSERIVVAAEHEAAFVLDARFHVIGIARERIEAALACSESTRKGLRFARPAPRGSALQWALARGGFSGTHLV